VAETCVTVTWIQLNSQLLRLTGHARFGDELERTFYNHLAAAQRPDGAEWCYFTSLDGKKPYGPGINCCVSSGPRGMALVPEHAWLKLHRPDADALVLNLFDTSRASVRVNNALVTAEFRSEFPKGGSGMIALSLNRPATFALVFRQPTWAAPLHAQVNGQDVELTTDAKGWRGLAAREWKNGDHVALTFHLGGRLIPGEHGNRGEVALAWGPFILAYDEARNPELPKGLEGGNSIALNPPAKGPLVALEPGAGLAFSTELWLANAQRKGELVPFADAGRDGGHYRVWLGNAGPGSK
jgi:DUF1680 family protein